MSDFDNNNQDGMNSKKSKHNSSGIKLFLIIACIVCVFAVFVCLGFVIYTSNKSTNNDGDSLKFTTSGTSEDNTSVNTSSDDSSSDETSDSTSVDSSDSLDSSDDSTSSEEIPNESSNMLNVTVDGKLIELSSEEIAQKVMPSIVGVVSYIKQGETLSGYSTGSGIIMTDDGKIITNAHVILDDNNKPTDKVEVYLNNEETAIATVLGFDVKTDLAVLDIEKENLVAAEFGDSSALKIGEKAVAIGNPTGLTLSSSFTQGVISGLNRQIDVNDQGYVVNYIQTDAAINPGNSGGALVNKYGQVVGVNSSKISATEYEGLGFSIPINEAEKISQSLIANGYVTGRPRLGITFTSITVAMAEVYKVPSGMRVISVDQTTDAYKQGVVAGDIITHVNSEAVITLSDVSTLLKDNKPGENITLTIYRVEDSKEKTIDVSIKLAEFTE